MKKWRLFLSALLLVSANACSEFHGESGDILQTSQVFQFDGVPWGMSLLDDHSAIITLKKGEVYRVNLLNGSQQILTGLPKVNDKGQGGLLDVAKSPHFSQDALLYFTYAKPSDKGAATTLARAKLVGAALSQWQDLLVTDSASSQSIHYGSRIAFDHENHVFFSVGDRGARENAQDRSNHAGSIIRLNLDGSVPKDNPFAHDHSADHSDDHSDDQRIKKEIWSYGHRNPQGLFYDAKTQTLWANEHGPRGGDEINLIRPGANYGWPIVSHGKEYWAPIAIGDGQEKEGINSPMKVYIPSIAPSSLIRYRGGLFPDWEGDFLSTALSLRHLNQIKLDEKGNTTESRHLENLAERLRFVAQDSSGILYIGTDSGKLIKVSPAGK